MFKDIEVKPYSLIIRATDRCNVGCHICSLDCKTKGSDLSFQEAKNIISDLPNYTKLIHFSGGEPLLNKELVNMVEFAHKMGYYTEVTTSLYTDGNENDVRNIIFALLDIGLTTLMVSHDDTHAKKVNTDSLLQLIKEIQDYKSNTSLSFYVITEGRKSFLTVDTLKILSKNTYDIDINTIDWVDINKSLSGRAEIQNENTIYKEHNKSKCPYVIVAPTLTPNKELLLCPNIISKEKNFLIGKSSKNILELFNFQHKTIYKYLYHFGPYSSLHNLGFTDNEIPKDMCQACEKFLNFVQNDHEDILKSMLPRTINLDSTSLLPAHKKIIDNIKENY